MPIGTGIVYVISGAQDGAAKLVDTGDINDDQITYAKLQNISNTDRLLVDRAGKKTPYYGEIYSEKMLESVDYDGSAYEKSRSLAIVKAVVNAWRRKRR